jgi:choline dehydrogenase
VRAKPSDFAGWVALGAEGWSWEDVRPFYERAEAAIPAKRYPREAWQPVAQAFADAYLELGYRWVDDMNAPDAWDGVVGQWPQNRRNEIRLGTLPTYVRAARGRANLTIRGDALVDRVLLDGARATGVRLASGEEVGAALVLVCGGTFASPAILMRSGIGPAEELGAIGVDCVADLPVGQGLRDHPQCLFVLDAPASEARMCGPGFAVAARGDGFFSFPVALDEERGLVAVSIALNRQAPDGVVRLVDRDPHVLPAVEMGLERVVERDDFAPAWDTFTALAGTDAFASRGIGGGDARRARVDAVTDRLGNAFHPACTCAIGRVVDTRLRVLGVDRLMVADASVFPENVSNNLNMTCVMVGERAAAFAAESGVGYY